MAIKLNPKVNKAKAFFEKAKIALKKRNALTLKEMRNCVEFTECSRLLINEKSNVLAAKSAFEVDKTMTVKNMEAGGETEHFKTSLV